MDLSALGGLLRPIPDYVGLRQSLEGCSGALTRAQVLSEAVPFLLATLWRDLGRPMLIVTPRPEDARKLHDQLLVWGGEDGGILQFPETEALPFERLVSDLDTIHARIRTLSTLAGVGHRAPLVVASTAAIAQKTIRRDSFLSNTRTLRVGDRVDLNEMLETWTRLGYRFEPTVAEPGVASRRGGIVDVYPVDSTLPARIELWGNEIDSIRLFDPSTQRSSDSVDSVRVIPAGESLPEIADRAELALAVAAIDVSGCTDAARSRIDEEMELLLSGAHVEDVSFYAGLFNHGSLLDYLADDFALVTCRPTDVAHWALDAEERIQALRWTKESRGELPHGFPSSHFAWAELEQRLERVETRLEVTPWGATDLAHDRTYILPFSSPPTFAGNLDAFAEEVADLAGVGHRPLAVTSHPKRLGEVLDGYGVAADTVDALSSPPDPGSITIVRTSGGMVSEGFSLDTDDGKLVVLSDSEIFGVTKQRRSARRASRRREALLAELGPGDYVVHVEHGIGRFAGTGSPGSEKTGAEYIVLDYARGDKLYVPMEHLDRVTPYVAPLDHPPSLTRLGSQEWKRARAKAARSTREMAAELLSLYATRELAEGHPFGLDRAWETELGESFPFEETPDQVSAIREVKADMGAPKPMDRLVCGDVGYGKTEVAIRAAFKAVMDGKQVAVLVPTTVLAQQHYATFSERLKAYPTAIDVLSRFRTDAEQRAVVEGLARGTIDVCIGTHRLIQRDVSFKQLGLIIIDEEQRFGVAHKERLRRMRAEVDVLTMTATPIPRTLHMSLAGVRDMSTIDTPPEERLPIKTYVSEFSDDLIREAILRELDRQGQVYFLHNRVYNIDYMAGYVRRLVPEAKVAVAHGQMPEGRLEQVMLDFARGEGDVLMCTTIIESGLDIPNVNTLIMNRADTFGLAQLYQLRGRIGRSVRRAYAYLLVPRARSLTEAAEKRLSAMLAATELGAGYKIAMKDLEIRGAGNILGADQSGHIHAVGFELYNRLLSLAVEQLRAKGAPFATNGGGLQPGDLAAAIESELPGRGLDDALVTPSAPLIDIGIPASIPLEYVADLSTRLGIYQRLVQLADPADVDRMEEELQDRFGPLPVQVRNLSYVTRLKMYAAVCGVESVKRAEGRVVLRLEGETGGARQVLQSRLGRGVVVGNNQIRLELDQSGDGWEERLMRVLTSLAEFRRTIDEEVAAAAAS